MIRRRILLVEDEPGLRRTVKDLLASSGYTVETSQDGADAQTRAEAESFDLIVLDVMLPSKSGFDVAKALRKNGVLTPILMLTARTELNNKLQGFKAGADDYLTKPFEPPELLVRIEALLRRSDTGVRKKLANYDVHGMSFDFAKARMTKKGQVISLSERE
jgi:two-component system alkaline phosphatase synthesis response regulator PhoP